MSTLSTLKSLVSTSLGTQASNVFTSDKKTSALNWARKHILLKYEVDEFIVESTLTFTSGKATIPTDYLRFIRLYDSSDKTETWSRVTVNLFDNDINNTWTIKDDSGTRKVHVYPTSTSSLVLRYYKLPTDLSADADLTGFNIEWDEAHASFASYYLLQNDGQFERAGYKKREAEEMIERILQSSAQELGGSEITSYYQDYNILEQKINSSNV